MDIEQSYRWLKSGDIKGETESKIVTAQDQAISTNYFKNKILKEENECKCRLCKQQEETIDHLTLGCPILVKNEYLMRHDKVCTHLYYSIRKALRIETTNNWYCCCCYYYYYYYYHHHHHHHPCYRLYAGNLQLYTRNKPRFYDIQCCSCSVFTIYATCNVISPAKYVLYLYISTSRSKCAVHNMAVFCTSFISYFPGRLLRYCLSDFGMVPVVPIITGITSAFTFHMC